jgi:hypothetical protein
VPLYDQSRELLGSIERAHAIELWRAGKVRLRLRRNRTVGAVEASPVDDRVYSSRPYLGAGRRYSHKHETEENPEGVWTLVRIDTRQRPIFVRVLTDCLAA